MNEFTRKLLVVSLSAAAVLVGVPAQAAASEETPQADQQFCEFVPRVCQALCLGEVEGRCRRPT